MSTVKNKDRTTNDRSFLDDRESFQALVNSMPTHEQEEYRSYKSLTLEAAFPSRKMILYTLAGGQPTDIVILHFGGMSMDLFEGPKVELHNNKNKDTFVIEMVPKRFMQRDVFLQIPQNFEFKWKGKQAANSDGEVHFVSHFAILAKSKSQARMNVDGHTYCVRLNDFREAFPALNVRY